MDQNFQTSFIPKKPMVQERVVYTRPVGILLVASILILVTVILATGGLYVYNGVLTKKLADMTQSLNTAQQRFEPSKITELQLLDKRLNAATEILNNHINTTPIFIELGKLTMTTVRYTKFSYDLSTDKNANVDVKMSGQAIGYRSIALQSDLLTSSKVFIDPVFSNLTLDPSGNVLFDLDFSVDPAFVNYEQTILTNPQT